MCHPTPMFVKTEIVLAYLIKVFIGHDLKPLINQQGKACCLDSSCVHTLTGIGVPIR